MNNFSPLQRRRLSYQPSYPSILEDFHLVTAIKKELPSDPSLAPFFPHTHALPFLSFTQTDPLTPQEGKAFSPLKVGIILSGGPAPGGQNVIAGVFDALKKMNCDSTLIGFLNGPMGIIENNFIELTKEKVDLYRNQGGFEIIGSGRTKIETAEQFECVRQTIEKHALDGLIIVGGDDSNTNGAFLAEYCKEKKMKTQIIGVPKTIDGDLKNEFIELSFGFDTAAKTYSEIIGNLAKDALSAKKYYFFVKLMGRSASHLTLECALQTHVNLSFIGEEIGANALSLEDIVNQVTDLICERAAIGKNYGVILLPEGLLEFIPAFQLLIKELNQLFATNPTFGENLIRLEQQERNHFLKQHLTPSTLDCFLQMPEEIQKQFLLDLDPHGYIQFSKIETERLLITLVEKKLAQRKKIGKYVGKFNPQPIFCGYEGRSALPSNFDCQYCYALGRLAALLILHQASGYMCSIKHLTKEVKKWEIGGVPIVGMLHFEVRKNKRQPVLQKALVDVEGAVFLLFKQLREGWRLADNYRLPGPIQFEGPPEITDVISTTLEKGTI